MYEEIQKLNLHKIFHHISIQSGQYLQNINKAIKAYFNDIFSFSQVSIYNIFLNWFRCNEDKSVVN